MVKSGGLVLVEEGVVRGPVPVVKSGEKQRGRESSQRGRTD